MQLLLLALILPYVLAQEGCTTFDDPVCPENHELCDGGADDKGCPYPKTCELNDPNADCSSTWECPKRCPFNDLTCARGNDENGCARVDECMASDTGNPDCTAQCNDACDLATQYECPGATNSKGCQERTTCQYKDQNFPDWRNCPVTCGEGEKLCGGMPGKTSDECVTEKDANGCDTPCNVECGDDQKKCEFGNDENGCPRENKCVSKYDCCENEKMCERGDIDMTATPPIWKEPVCKTKNPLCGEPICPGEAVECSDDQKRCSPGDDEKGCPRRDTCVPKDACCENERLCKRGEFDMFATPPSWKEPVCKLKSSPCKPLCPEETAENCKPNEVFCEGQTETKTDATGNPIECPTPGTCVPRTYSKCEGNYGEQAVLCTNKNCPAGERLCDSMGVDADGCNIPQQCSAGGVCPGDEPAV